MREFDYFRKASGQYRPKSPAAALKGIGSEHLPAEAFVYVGTSVKPLDEEPYDFDGIERVLAREDLDIGTNLLLVRIFEKLVKREDSEVALLAAEGINQIENRYNHKIEKLKSERDTGNVTEKTLQGKLARCYHEFARLYPENSSIRVFYLKEAYDSLPPPDGPGDLYDRIKILLDLRMFDQASHFLKEYGDPEDISGLLLEAEIEYFRRNFTRVFQICSWCLQREDKLTSSQLDVVNYWLGIDERQTSNLPVD